MITGQSGHDSMNPIILDRWPSFINSLDAAKSSIATIDWQYNAANES
jgi:hypothetical protein